MIANMWGRSCPERAIDEQQLSGVHGWNSGREAAAGQGPKTKEERQEGRKRREERGGGQEEGEQL